MAGRVSTAKRRALVEEWKTSGESRLSFSRRKGVNDRTFCGWVARFAPEKVGRRRRCSEGSKEESTVGPVAASEPDFILVSPPESQTEPFVDVDGGAMGSEPLVVELPSGASLRFGGLPPASYLKRRLGLG